jgi:hypothetical protein
MAPVRQMMSNFAWAPFLGLLSGTAPGAAASGVTCGDLKSFYKTEACCGSPSKVVSSAVPGTRSCPYNFEKPACNMAEPQAPRDLSTGATGEMTPKAATLTDAQANFLPLVNIHYHLGAEHKSDDYNIATDSTAYDAANNRRLGEEGFQRRLGEEVRPGFMCKTSDLSSDQLKEYTFQYCKGQVSVGKSYEVHYVHSSAGYTTEMLAGLTDIDGIDDGLGGAANGRGLLNPMVVVQGQVYQIVNGADEVSDMLSGWTVPGHTNAVMYPGSTTGQSHDNAVCSPYSITWHVDKTCHRVSPASFDNMCKQMKEKYGLEVDLYPHGSRKILDPKWVVKSEFVKALA